MSKVHYSAGNISDLDLWCLLIRAWNSLSRLRELELAQFGITVVQLSILKITRVRGGSITAKELEYLTMRQQHSISTLINRMVKSGLLSKKKEPNERRYRIFTTLEGEKLANQVTTAAIDMAFSSLTEEEKKQFSYYIYSIYSKTRDLLLGISFNLPFLKESEADNYKIQAQPYDSHYAKRNYELWSLLDITGFSVFRLRELELAKCGLTLEQSMILAVIDHFGGSTTSKDIEYFLVRQHHSISTLINRMIARGLVSKNKALHEKKYRITMTADGKKVFSEITTDSIELVFAFLTKKKRAEFTHILTTIHANATGLLGMQTIPPLNQPVESLS